MPTAEYAGNTGPPDGQPNTAYPGFTGLPMVVLDAWRPWIFGAAILGFLLLGRKK